MSEKRGRDRCLTNNQAHVFWTDASGQYRQEKATITDISPAGIGIVIGSRIEARTQLGIRSSAWPTTVSASVRHSRQKGLNYFTGLELPMPESSSRG